MSWLIALLFRCRHKRETWPMRHEDGRDYRSCLDCGHKTEWRARDGR